MRKPKLAHEEFMDMIDRKIAEQRAAEEIKCPFCGYVYDPIEAFPYVSYWGDEEVKEASCPSCDKEFMVNEIVTREFEVTKLEEHVDIEA
jgi:uncharacterized Zn-finger protein